jgi:hypothetical protein
MRGKSFQLVSGRQLRAARNLAGLTQVEFSLEAGFNPKAAKYWEANLDRPPSTSTRTINRIEQTLAKLGVTVFSEPTPGVRLSGNPARRA